MILIEGVKFSCLECIRGHRSTQCRHHQRPLLKVRSKGRPNLLHPDGSKNYRIAVFAEQVDENSDDDSCKNTPVVILKASDEHVIDLKDGRILGKYDEHRNARPLVNEKSFINTKLCCALKMAKPKLSCGCNQRVVLRQKIIRSYLDKKIKHWQNDAETADSQALSAMSLPGAKTPLPLSLVKPEEREVPAPASGKCCSKKAPKAQDTQNSQHPPPIQDALHGKFSAPAEPFDHKLNTFPHPTQPVSLMMNRNEMEYSMQDKQPFAQPSYQVFEAISVPSCTLEGTCCCSSDCNCPNCVVHNNAPYKPQENYDFLNNDAQYGSNLFLKAANPAEPHADPRHPSTVRSHEPYASILAQLPTNDPNIPGFLYDLQTALQTGPQPREDSQSPAAQGSCSCADDECFCSNCETHGIVDGYKLDEVFGNPVARLS